MPNPLPILKSAIKKVPFIKYALGIVGIVAAVSIIKAFNIENNNGFPLLSILVMLALMVLLFVFSTFLKSESKSIRLAGHVMIWTILVIFCLSSFLLASSVFFNYPKPIGEYIHAHSPDDEKQAAIDKLEAAGVSWFEKNKLIKGVQMTDLSDRKLDTLTPSFAVLKPLAIEIAFNPMPANSDDILGFNQFTDLNGLAQVKTLESLTINYSRNLKNLSGLKSLKTLNTLHLHACFGLQNIDGIQDLTNLTYLNLMSCFDLNNLDGLQNLPKLEILEISSCKSVQNIEALIGLKSLTKLDLALTAVKNTTGLGDLPNLTFLDMHSCYGLKDVDGLIGAPKLSQLILANCPFLTNVDGLKNIASLEILNLGQNGRLTNIQALGTLTNLKSLSLMGCVSLSDVTSLMNLHNLKELYLQMCPQINIKQVEALRAALPQTKIIYRKEDNQAVADTKPVDHQQKLVFLNEWLTANELSIKVDTVHFMAGRTIGCLILKEQKDSAYYMVRVTTKNISEHTKVIDCGILSVIHDKNPEIFHRAQSPEACNQGPSVLILTSHMQQTVHFVFKVPKTCYGQVIYIPTNDLNAAIQVGSIRKPLS